MNCSHCRSRHIKAIKKKMLLGYQKFMTLFGTVAKNILSGPSLVFGQTHITRLMCSILGTILAPMHALWIEAKC